MTRSLPTDLAPTPRQRQVCRCLWGGMGTAQIAAYLGIHPITVAAHLTELYRRLGIDGSGNPRVLAAIWLWREEYGR